MKKRKSILLVVLLMAVGFAAVSTTLYINGATKISANQDDFNVYYSDAYVNGTQDKSVITDNTHITFTTTLKTLGEKYVLDYDVTNGSKNYDAELVMECTQGNEYLSVTNVFDDDTNLEAQGTRRGTLTLEQIKSYTGEDLDVTIKCTISANAIERSSVAETVEGDYSIAGTLLDANNDPVANANLAVFSNTPHYVTTDSTGYFAVSGLEEGEHEIYYISGVSIEDLKAKDKATIQAEATAEIITNTSVNDEKVSSDSNYSIHGAKGMKNEELSSHEKKDIVVISGDGYTPGDEISLYNQHFYVLDYTDNKLLLITKYPIKGTTQSKTAPTMYTATTIKSGSAQVTTTGGTSTTTYKYSVPAFNVITQAVNQYGSELSYTLDNNVLYSTFTSNISGSTTNYSGYAGILSQSDYQKYGKYIKSSTLPFYIATTYQQPFTVGTNTLYNTYFYSIYNGSVTTRYASTTSYIRPIIYVRDSIYR